MSDTTTSPANDRTYDQVLRNLRRTLAAYQRHAGHAQGKTYARYLADDVATLLAAMDGEEPPDQPTIRTMLDVSTKHLPEEYGAYQLSDAPGVIAHSTEYGWLMWVPNDPADSSAAMEDPVPPEILTVQLYARKHGCDYVLFDADADTVDDLPTWDW